MARQDQAPWRDEGLLRRKYVEEEKSTYQIGEELGCANTTVWSWLQKHGIETRDQAREWPLDYHMERGYEVVSSSCGSVRIHRLLAVAEFGFDAVCNNIVHHENGIPWDNRTENISLMSRGDHAAHHNEETGRNQPWADEDRLRQLYLNEGMSCEEIGGHFGCSADAIWNRLKQYEIPTRPPSNDVDRPWHDESTLRELYMDDGLARNEIAERFGCHPDTIGRWLRKHDLSSNR